MSRLTLGLLTFALASSHVAYAALETEIAPTTEVRSSQPIAQNGIYKFGEDSELVPLFAEVRGEMDQNQDAVGLGFNKGEAIHAEFAPDHQVIVSLNVSEDEKDTVPERVVISEDEFRSKNLSFVSEGSVENFHNSFSSTPITNVAWRSWGRVASYSHHRRPGNCVHYVLGRLGVHVRGNGKDIAGALMHVGFHHDSCSSPRVGTVASWSGGWHGLGHTGIWNGSCFAYDRGCGDPGHMYHLKFCVHR